MSKQVFRDAVARLKAPGAPPLEVTDETGLVVAFLHIASAHRTDLDTWAIDVSVWRNRHRERFATQFEATPKNARKYLDSLIESNDQAFFMIIDSIGNRLGHFGFKLTEDDAVAELDNLVRSEAAADNSLTYFVELTLLLILFNTCGIASCNVYVLKDNRAAFGLHRLCGFNKDKVVPVRREETDDVIQLVGDETIDPQLAVNAFVFLSLARDRFFDQRANWVNARAREFSI
ncbi:MAG: hypothetical protein AAF583_03825 [Pseudomonadota bacterium]